ncbi:MAG: DNA-binding protein WhiA [Faecalimonas sp.]|nr:DNA-binding protein WhiA [Faecalimonas sp.]
MKEQSFSGKIKEELSRHQGSLRHCQLAELAAMISLCGRVEISSRGQYLVKIRTENVSVARKSFTLLQKAFNIEAEAFVSTNMNSKNVIYTVIVRKHQDAVQVLRETHLLDADGEIAEEFSLEKNPLLHRSCCKRAFLRGAFLAAGSMSDPNKSYHIEVVCAAQKKARQIRTIINGFGLEAKVIPRKNSYVVYLKEGAQIVDLLNVMEAPLALMEMENVRILKEMRNSVNRKVNCETANINKTVSAAVKQIEDIRFIRDTVGFGTLPEGLAEIAGLRLEYPNATLKELGELLSTPLGKSGVNHRIRKLSEIAEQLREA